MVGTSSQARQVATRPAMRVRPIEDVQGGSYGSRPTTEQSRHKDLLRKRAEMFNKGIEPSSKEGQEILRQIQELQA